MASVTVIITPMAEPTLTLKEKARILRDVSLGVPAPDHESEAARHWRTIMEKQVEEGRDQGFMNEIPFDPEAD